MNNRKRVQAFVDEFVELCDKHDMFLISADLYSSGNLAIVDRAVARQSGPVDWLEENMNYLRGPAIDCCVTNIERLSK